MRGYQSFKQDEVRDRLINDLGAPIVGSASRWLDKAHIRHRTRVLIGEPVQTILRCAAEERCDSVVIGERPPEGMTCRMTAMFGASPILRLLAATATPVVVVK